MTMSESISELSAALAKAQAELKNPAFDSNNPHFRSKYASLASVRDTVIPIISKHGLSIVQMPVFEDGKAGCETMLLHSSGQHLASRLMIPVDKANAHGVGSAITYSRRFSLMAFVGVVGDDDDDGNAAADKIASTSKPILKAPITPTTDAWDAVDPKRQEFCKRISEEIIEHLKCGRFEDAYVAFYGNLEEQKISNDEGHAIWADLGALSKERRKLKDMRDARTAKKEAA